MSPTEHDFEPTRGLPGRLPEGERILWQGAPDWRGVAVHTLHVRPVAAYFLLLAGGLTGYGLAFGGLSQAQAIGQGVLVLLAGAIVLCLLAGFAFAVARTSVYTLTTRRLVLRVGVAISKAVNVPFSLVDSAALRLHGGATGDIPVKLRDGARLSYLILWPHVRPLRFNAPEPMLRAVGAPQHVARLLADALQAEVGGRVNVPQGAVGPQGAFGPAGAGGAASPARARSVGPAAATA